MAVNFFKLFFHVLNMVVLRQLSTQCLCLFCSSGPNTKCQNLRARAKNKVYQQLLRNKVLNIRVFMLFFLLHLSSCLITCEP